MYEQKEIIDYKKDMCPVIFSSITSVLTLVCEWTLTS